MLSAVKFLFVIFYFMHLRWDKVFCTILFFIGLILAGGMESMNGAPYLVPNARFGYRLGNGTLVDAAVADGLWCALEDCHMGTHAERVAIREQVSRVDQDAFALESHRRAVAAQVHGVRRATTAPGPVRIARITFSVSTSASVTGVLSALIVTARFDW